MWFGYALNQIADIDELVKSQKSSLFSQRLEVARKWLFTMALTLLFTKLSQPGEMPLPIQNFHLWQYLGTAA